MCGNDFSPPQLGEACHQVFCKNRLTGVTIAMLRRKSDVAVSVDLVMPRFTAAGGPNSMPLYPTNAYQQALGIGRSPKKASAIYRGRPDTGPRRTIIWHSTFLAAHLPASTRPSEHDLPLDCTLVLASRIEPQDFCSVTTGDISNCSQSYLEH